MTDLGKIQEMVSNAVKKETDSLRNEIEALKTENAELRKKVQELDHIIDVNEQYSRKSSLILSGGGIPDPPSDREETTSEIRATTKAVIEKQLKVKLQGGMAACHRLRNKKRVLVKLHVLADREAVYQARFNQNSENKGLNIIVHENLTERRAAQIRVLGKLRSDQEIANYHTRNGNIFARISTDRKYAKIEPTYTKEEIMQVLTNTEALPYRQGQADRTLGQRKTEGLPDRHHRMNNQCLGDYVVPSARQTRQQAKATGDAKSKKSEVRLSSTPPRLLYTHYQS